MAARLAARGTKLQQRMRNQGLAVTFALLCAALAAAPAGAETAAAATPADTGGFYGGIALRQAGTESTGVIFGAQSQPWANFASPVADDASSRRLFFGGYRFQNDVSLEASFATSERYVLRPDNPAGRSGVGLSLMSSDAAARAWNADVYTSWSFLRRFALYGRLGYAQSDNAGGLGMTTLAPGDVRRGRDGVNYGVGLRYDFTPALGLRVEYARFGRFAGETLQGGVLPETDQLQLGVQLRF
jgi:opacity protein-like surface antigen